MESIHILYPENRYVSEDTVIVWAMDDLVNSEIARGAFKDDEDGSQLAAYSLGMKRPTLRQAMEILSDNGSVTFDR